MWGNGHLSPLLSEGGVKDTHGTQAQVGPTCDPSYSGGRDQDCGSVSALGKESERSHHKKGLME
jgi:hypothetical protein